MSHGHTGGPAGPFGQFILRVLVLSFIITLAVMLYALIFGLMGW